MAHVVLLFLSLLCGFIESQLVSFRTASMQATSQTAAQLESKRELHEAARSYVDGNFAEAQLHSEKALAFDPLSKVAPRFIARCIHAQYRPGEQSEENSARARDAIQAYKRILESDQQDDESYRAIAYLLEQLKEEELLREWIQHRAFDVNNSPALRAEALTVLASKDWDCSFRITESPTSKTKVRSEDGSVELRYVKPKNLGEFEKANRCAANGLEMVEAAIGLVPDSDAAWAYKTNLLLELSKLAEMNNDLRLRAEYQKRFEAAQATTSELESNARQRADKP
jgi:hypothetical protein